MDRDIVTGDTLHMENSETDSREPAPKLRCTRSWRHAREWYTEAVDCCGNQGDARAAVAFAHMT